MFFVGFEILDSGVGPLFMLRRSFYEHYDLHCIQSATVLNILPMSCLAGQNFIWLFGVITNFQEYKSVIACLVHPVLIIGLIHRGHLYTDKITSLHIAISRYKMYIIHYQPDVCPQSAFR